MDGVSGIRRAGWRWRLDLLDFGHPTALRELIAIPQGLNQR